MARPATFHELMVAKAAERAAVGDPVRKDIPPTFAALEASAEVADWLPTALYTLREVIDAALGSTDPTLTPEVRLTAIANSVDEFKVGLVERAGQALGAQAIAKGVFAIGKKSRWTGLL